MQHPNYAIEEIRRVAALGCRVALVRPMDAMGNYPIQPKYEPVWHALEETGMVYGMHPFPAFGSSKPSGYSEQYSGAELIRRTVATAGLPHSFLTNVQNFQAEAALWVTIVLMSGFFEVLPRFRCRGGIMGACPGSQMVITRREERGCAAGRIWRGRMLAASAVSAG